MTDTIDHGGPAFPHDKYMKNGDQWGTYAHGGMSLRDYFAAAALPTLLQRVYADCDKFHYNIENAYDIAADASYELADAMIAARGSK